MNEHGHAAVELAMGVAVLLLPVALMVTAFGPWAERRVLGEAAAAEAARAVAVSLDHSVGAAMVSRITGQHGLDESSVRLGWCGATPSALAAPAGVCALVRGGMVSATVHVWAPLVATPWGDVGGLWVTAEHSEPIDLYRSLP